ncbi:hypothetical protein K7I13_00155 [Brucepastera parasyntrophica]|uniref:DUF6588 family protein n=1 Tax=Brucepastera parasyntrophica TaxID=2880008 RepID=UPI00210877C9|nr:DUF6588 family protein [Brucepastera parasyntrophica]ULQ59815.1 hypothetical protein K7I13_00155 [Brucepastera parasyntrophica]
MKKLLLILFIILITVSGLSAQSAVLDDFNDALNSFLGEINTALPDSAVVGGTWSNAYIGQLIGVPPHFGIGIAAGITRFPVQALKDAIELTGADLPVDTLILPNFAVEGRIGGIVLPFDLGFRFGMLPEVKINKVSVKYLNFGADIRYAILKDRAVIPALSVGIGYYHTSGSVGYTFSPSELGIVGIPPQYTQDSELGIDFSSNVIEAKVQVSKNIVVITPYAGLAGYVAFSDSNYTVANQKGSNKETLYGARVFGGLSFNIAVVKIDLYGMYNFVSGNWGANAGLRVQI